MGRVVIQATAAFRALGTPGGTFRLQHHRAIGLAQHMRHFADHVQVQQALDLLEGADEAVVVADLVDQAFFRRQAGRLLAFLGVETERLFAKHVDILVQRGQHHLAMHARWRRDDHGIKFQFIEHEVEVRIGLDARIFAQDVEHVAGGVADGRQCDTGMCIDHRVMGQAHLAQAYYCEAYHIILSFSAAGTLTARAAIVPDVVNQNLAVDELPLDQVIRGAALFQQAAIRWFLRCAVQVGQRLCGCQGRPVLEGAHFQQVAVNVEQGILVNGDGGDAQHGHLARHGAAGADEQVAIGRDIGDVESSGDHAHAGKLGILVMHALLFSSRQ
ncbi:hypothetical protein D3C72_1324220 [compost metagenome]